MEILPRVRWSDNKLLGLENAHEMCGNAQFENAKSPNYTGGIIEYNVSGVGMMRIYCDVKTDGRNWIVSGILD